MNTLLAHIQTIAVQYPRPLRYLGYLLLLLLPATNSHALEVGELQLQSALGEPLVAYIQISNHDGYGEDELKIEHAPNEVYKKMGVDASILFQDFSFSLQPDGQVNINSRQPIKEPYLNFVLQFRWPQGVMYREFSVLVDPK